MSMINPMFSNNLRKSKSKKITQKPKDQVQKRKKRIDAKHDIKIPLSLEQRQKIKIHARESNKSVTAYCSDIIISSITENNEFRRVKYYNPKEKSIHAKISRLEGLKSLLVSYIDR